MEQRVGSLIKDPYMGLDLGAIEDDVSRWGNLRNTCTKARPLPFAPEAFNEVMDDGSNQRYYYYYYYQ